MKKKITQRELIKQDIEEAISKQIQNSITNCNFVGAMFDDSAIDAIEKIAEGVIQNAMVLRSLADVLKASNVEIDTMIRIDPGNKTAGG